MWDLCVLEDEFSAWATADSGCVWRWPNNPELAAAWQALAASGWDGMAWHGMRHPRSRLVSARCVDSFHHQNPLASSIHCSLYSGPSRHDSSHIVLHRDALGLNLSSSTACQPARLLFSVFCHLFIRTQPSFLSQPVRFAVSGFRPLVAAASFNQTVIHAHFSLIAAPTCTIYLCHSTQSYISALWSSQQRHLDAYASSPAHYTLRSAPPPAPPFCL